MSTLQSRRDRPRKGAATVHTCRLCERAFSRKTTLNRHSRTVHQSQGNGLPHHQYTCSFCNRQFKRKDTRDRHERLHTTQKVECITCGKMIAPRALDDHFRSRACRAMEVVADRQKIEAWKQSLGLASMDVFGRFGVESVADPLLVAAKLYFGITRGQLKTIRGQSDAFHLQFAHPRIEQPTVLLDMLSLRGIATRTISKSLRDPVQAGSPSLFCALSMMQAVEERYPFGDPSSSQLYGRILGNLWSGQRSESAWLNLHVLLNCLCVVDHDSDWGVAFSRTSDSDRHGCSS